MRRSVLSSFSLLLCVTAPAFGDFTLAPENPHVNETIYVRATPGRDGCDIVRTRDFTTTMSSNRITITMPIVAPGACFAVGMPAQPMDAAIGQLPAGNYEVEVLRQLDNVTTSLGTRSFTVQARKPLDPLVNYTDLWWDPRESGWGLNVVQHPSTVIVATWLEYDDDGRPAWYVVPSGEWTAADQNRSSANHLFTGPIYRTSGPTGGTIDPARVTPTRVGTANFEFYGWDRMNASFTINGRTRQKTLQRQPF